MWRFRRLLAKLRNLLRHQRAEQEMNREISSHLALLQDEFELGGLEPDLARLAARRAYGGVEQAKELHRAERSLVSVENALQDLRHAWRALIKRPAFLAVAIASIALAISVNTAIFALVNGVLVKTLPVPQPERVVQVNATGNNMWSTAFNFPVFRELRRQTDIFSDVIGFSSQPAVAEVNGGSQNVVFELVTGSYFSFFSARPALGRLIDEEDDRVELAHHVCVLSYPAWQRYFDADPAAVERTLNIDGVPLQIIGVAAPDFVGAELQRRYDVWAPTAVVGDFSNPRESPSSVWLRIMARLRPGVSLAEAAARLERATPSIDAALPKDRANASALYQIQDASRGFDTWRSSLQQPLLILMGCVILVLLLACANLANLLLARGSDRHLEFVIKLSLGISRTRLMRQLFVETVLLGLAGGFVGILLSSILTGILGSNYIQLNVAHDSTVVVFTLGACLLASLTAGAYPAFQASRTAVNAGLKGGLHSGLHRAFIRRGLIVTQVTVAVTLLFGATLLAHSLRRLKTVDLGYDIDRILTVEVSERGPKSARRLPATAPVLANPVPVAGADLTEALDRVRELPGIESAALCRPDLLSGSMLMKVITYRDASGVEVYTTVNSIVVSPAYLPTLRIALLAGRDFESADHAGGVPACIANQALASQLWPGQSAIGKHIKSAGKDFEVIGIVGNTKYRNVREQTLPILYLALAQDETAASALEARCRGPFAPIDRGIRQIIRSVAPAYQVSQSISLEHLRDTGIARDRLLSFASGVFGALGTVLALVGIYGLISYSVSQRTREVGVRMSLGARPAAVLWLFLREVAIMIAAGVVMGLPLALLLARFLRSMLFEVSISDPLGIAATITLLAAGGLAASFVPARRATRVNPIQALRYD